MNRNDIIRSFDWHYTDISPRDSARYDALKYKPRESSTLAQLISADSLIGYALWTELPRNHPVAELWLETNTDLLATIYLAYGGFFRQALSAVRSWFEISVDGVFFSEHYGQSTQRYEQWKSSQRNSPANMKAIAQSFARRTQIGPGVDENTFIQKLAPIYSFLSEHTHGQGIEVYRLQEGRDNVPRYIEKSFDLWYKYLLKSFDAIYFLYNTFFPDKIAAYLNSSKQEMKRFRMLDKELSQQLSEFTKLAQTVYKISTQSQG